MSETKNKAGEQSARQKEWNDQFGDHVECPVCGTACEMLFVEEVSDLQAKVSRLEQALRKIGNVIGGPTMNYAPNIERKELLARVQKVSELVVAALSGEQP